MEKAVPKMKILFVAQSMVVGGVERSLLSVLNLIPRDGFNVTLVLFRKEGALLPSVPSHVNVVEMRLDPCDRYQLETNRKDALKMFVRKGHWIAAIRMLWQRVVWNLGGRRRDFNLMVVESMMRRADRSVIDAMYDAAFAYAGGYVCSCYVRDVVKARTKSVWCHNENELSRMANFNYAQMLASFNYRFASGDLTRRANQILSCNGGMCSFSVMPLYIDVELFRKRAKEGPGFCQNDGKLRILTVGRLSYQKGIDVAVRIAKKLKVKGLKFEWFVIGGGSNEYESGICKIIQENGVEDVFKLLGEKLNPYPYIAQCDIYAQPSRWEAYCITVAEARAFAKPIIATDFIGAREQLKDGLTGMVVPLHDDAAFCRGIERLLLDEKLRKEFSTNLGQENLSRFDDVQAYWMSLLRKER